LKSFAKYFVQGLLVTVPLSITLLILFKLFMYVTTLLGRFQLNINPYVDPLIALVVIVVVIFLMGLIASSLIFQSAFTFFEKTMEHAPVVKHIYSPVKDFIQAFVGNKKRFTKPVLVRTNPQAEIDEMGFITQEDLSELGIKDKVAVYMPHSYAFSGKLIIVPKHAITMIDAKGGSAMKFIVTGGVADMNEEELKH